MAKARNYGAAAEGEQDGRFLTTLQRGLAVLEHMATTDDECSAKRISHALNLNRGVCYHILRTLAHDGYVVRTSNGNYILGPRLGNLFDTYQAQLEPSDDLVTILHGLRAETGESVYITGWSNQSIAIRYYLEGEGAVRIRRTSIGYNQSPHARAAARAILAFMPEEHLPRYLPLGSLEKVTDKTVTDPRELLAKLRRVRETGLSFEEEEFAQNVACLGSPIFDERGYPIGAIGMSMILAVYKDRFTELSTAVLTAGEQASRKSGWTGNYPRRNGMTPEELAVSDENVKIHATNGGVR